MRIDKLTTTFQEALAEAQSLAVTRDNPYIEPVHVLAAMLGQADGPKALLARAGVNAGKRGFDGGKILAFDNELDLSGIQSLALEQGLGELSRGVELVAEAGERIEVTRRAHARIAMLAQGRVRTCASSNSCPRLPDSILNENR